MEKLGLQAVALAAAPDVKKHPVDLPRLAMFSTWGSTQDLGWVRYAFDKFEVNYDLIYKERIKQGNLRAAYDVIVIPSQGGRGGGAKGLIFDIDPQARQDLRVQEGPRVPQPRRHTARARISRAAWGWPVSPNWTSSSTAAAY